ncbi:unnamed protein product, partial [Rotaria sp. Silwood1]
LYYSTQSTRSAFND